MWQAIYYIVVLILSIALAPKPPKPKAAALEDFDIPVAEEDRPVPVVFGEVAISGPNVLWYGDLRTSKIKKNSLFSTTTIGYQYYLGLHFGLCHGPIDAFLKITAGEKIAWEGNLTDNTTTRELIDKRSLFGGKKREGGLFGGFDLMMGADDQEPNDYLELVTEQNPAYRGIVGVVWRTGNPDEEFTLEYLFGTRVMGYIGNTPYLKPWAFVVRRILKGWENDTVWYSAKATINEKSMNPAHIIYECLTNTEWGMGESLTAIDDDSFRAAADQLFDEDFGLRLMWARTTTIDDFIGIVLDHIAGGLAFNRSTGQYMLVLFRNDYVLADLPVFNESNVKAVTGFQRQLWGETSNEMVVTYTDPDTYKETDIIAHDLANIQAQGARISQKISLTGIYDPDLAAKVVMRELVSRSTPLAKCSIVVNRSAWELTRGNVLNLAWSRLGLSGVAFRVINVPNEGTIPDGFITVDLVEDIFGLPSSVYIKPNDPVDDSEPPDPPDDLPEPENPQVQGTALSTPPATPTDGDKYYVPLTPPATGAWAGLEGTLVIWQADISEWQSIDIPPGQIIYDESTGEHVQTGVGGTIDPAPWALPLTTQGDLVVHDGSTINRLPVGDDDQVLTADSSQPLGVKWADNDAGGVSPVGETASACRVYKGANQSIPNTALTALTWVTESYDTTTYHSNVTNPSRLTALLDGKYSIGCTVKWDSSTTGVRAVYAVVNGVTSTRKAGSLIPASNGATHAVFDTVDLVATDYVEFYVYQDSGGSVNVVSLEEVTSAFIARVGVTAAQTAMRGATWVRAIPISLPVGDVPVRCPVNAQITSVSLVGEDVTGSCVVDIWKDTDANYPPTVADSICGSTKPTISSGRKYVDTTLTGWTTTVNAGDWLMFHLASSSGFKAVYIQLFMKETQ